MYVYDSSGIFNFIGEWDQEYVLDVLKAIKLHYRL